MTEEVIRIVREHGPDGNMINVERRVRIHRTEIQKPRVVAERRRWTKFGAAAGTAPGPEPGITIISEEPTFLEFRDFDLEKEQAAKPAETTAAKSGKYVPPSRSTIEATALQRQQEAQNGPPDRPGAYVPPSMRNQAMGGGAGGYQQGEKYSLLLSNIPDDADEEGLKEICRSRGVLNCDRLNVVRTKTNPSRAMKAYADFRTTEDRKKAQELLQGARYGFMILSAEIVNKDEGGGGARGGFGGGGFGGGGRY